MRLLVFFLILTNFCVAQSTSRKTAGLMASAYLKERKEQVREEREQEMHEKSISYDGKTMRYEYRKFGEKPKGGYPLYISMHGGGNATASVNDQQWKNQIRLYEPRQGYYVAPRAPTNTWNLWHEAHIDPMLDRLIENFVLFKGVNPNRVYLTGYSAGGDGTYQLAPRLADRFAAAAMMAGHPNETRPDNLMNLPFFIQCGEKDTAYKRNEVAREWGEKLDALEKAHPDYYIHKTIIYPEHGHWMNGEDKVAIPWMAEFSRNPWPKKITWVQDDVLVKRFYWLENNSPEINQRIDASVDGQTISIDSETVKEITVRLSDSLANLDEHVIIKQKDKILFEGKVERSHDVIKKSLNQRFDPFSTATAEVKVKLTPALKSSQ